MAVDAGSWVADVVLADGGTARVRPIEAADGAALVQFHSRQSRESIYYRYFSPRPVLREEEVAHLTTVDGVDRMAFVAELGGVLLGVARYDRFEDRPEAEVAFFTDDAHRGRGIATLLLEYLVARARQVGIHRFTAHVLPDNRRMVRVFRRAGFQARSTFSDGVVEVSLELEPTPEAAEAMAERARHGERQSVRRLLAPASVAVIGAGRDPAGLGHRVLRNLLAGPFEGVIHPVHPSVASVAGLRAATSILEVLERVDLAVVCVPAPEVPEVVADCGRAGVHTAIIISAGFAESGPEGAAAQAGLLAAARRYGMRILGPNCLGALNTDPAVRLTATFADVAPTPGPVGILAQSGTLGTVILERARALDVGVSSFVAVGNKADLSGNDLLNFWEDDERTSVVLLYLESFGNPRRFGRSVRRVAARKPVFAVRAGGAAERLGGQRPSGWFDDDTIDALLRQTGVVRVPTISQLLDVAAVAAHEPVPAGRRVAIVGNAGGSGALALDACLAAGLEVVQGGPALQPGTVSLRYDAGPEQYRDAVAGVLRDEIADSILVIHAPYGAEDPAGVLAAVDEARSARVDVPVVACVYAAHPPRSAGGTPVFDFPDDAAHALGAFARYGAWRASQEDAVVPSVADPAALRSAARTLLAGGGARWLGPAEVDALFRTGGLELTAFHVLEGPDSPLPEEIRWPVAVKAYAHSPGSRTEATGVALDVHGPEQLRVVAASIASSLQDAAWPMLVQPMVAAGVDAQVSVATHPVVGPVVRVGPGGAAGRYGGSSLHVLPVNDRAAVDLVASCGLGLDEASQASLVELVLRVAAMVEACPQITDVVCDPVLVRPGSTDVVDARLRLAPLTGDPEPAVRRI